MEHKEKLTELNEAKLKKVEEYLQSIGAVGEEHQEKIDAAKQEWQTAWNKFLEALLVLERLEI